LTLDREPPDILIALLDLLHERLGPDFSEYKSTTILRRVERRMRLHGYEHVERYLERLEDDIAEVENLYHDLLIGVTRFFRDTAAFDVLAREVIPALIEDGAVSHELRLWVPACATGQEAYSIAILFAEALGSSGTGRSGVKLFATDVHCGSLAEASEGWYRGDALEGMDRERIERFFIPEAGGYRVTPELREMISFAEHNLLADPPFPRIDLISCRNLLIYIKPEGQRRILPLLHSSLVEDGFLFLGPSESLGPLESEFAIVNRRWKLYRKLRDVGLGPAVQPQAAPRISP